MSDEDYHRGPNPFCELSIGMVSQFPIDYMHLVCLGVIKRFILLWISASKNWKKSTTKYIRFLANFKKIYTNFLLILRNLRKSIPMEFARKPRAIADVS